jgi:hypothetical protein
VDGTTSSPLKCLTINGGGDGCAGDHGGNDGYNSDAMVIVMVVMVVAVTVIMVSMAW